MENSHTKRAWNYQKETKVNEHLIMCEMNKRVTYNNHVSYMFAYESKCYIENIKKKQTNKK